VLGHDACGAVDAAIKVVNHGEKLPGHLPGLVGHLKPAVKAINATTPARPRTPQEFLSATIDENVKLNVERLKKAGPLISKFVEEGKVRVVGGVYRLATGKVDFFV
jgi:carbonic anhydrase